MAMLKLVEASSNRVAKIGVRMVKRFYDAIVLLTNFYFAMKLIEVEHFLQLLRHW